VLVLVIAVVVTPAVEKMFHKLSLPRFFELQLRGDGACPTNRTDVIQSPINKSYESIFFPVQTLL
jgi:hypothetical protein